MPYNDPSKGVSEPAYLPAPQWAPSSTQTGVQRKPAPSFGSSSSSGPALSGYGGSSLTNSPASSTQPGAAFQPASGGNKSIVCLVDLDQLLPAALGLLITLGFKFLNMASLEPATHFLFIPLLRHQLDCCTSQYLFCG